MLGLIHSSPGLHGAHGRRLDTPVRLPANPNLHSVAHGFIAYVHCSGTQLLNHWLIQLSVFKKIGSLHDTCSYSTDEELGVLIKEITSTCIALILTQFKNWYHINVSTSNFCWIFTMCIQLNHSKYFWLKWKKCDFQQKKNNL